jgi:hypothetical protein
MNTNPSEPFAVTRQNDVASLNDEASENGAKRVVQFRS